MKNGTRRLRSMTRIASAAAIISICAMLTIPLLPGVPLTLQTFGVVLCAAVLGSSESLCAVGLYLLLGAAGMPVFSAMRGGISVLLGPTGGFLIGLLPLSYLTGITKKQPVRLLFLSIGLLVCHVLGWLWMSRMGELSLSGGVMLGFLGYYFKDCVTGCFAIGIGARIRSVLRAQDML